MYNDTDNIICDDDMNNRDNAGDTDNDITVIENGEDYVDNDNDKTYDVMIKIVMTTATTSTTIIK